LMPLVQKKTQVIIDSGNHYIALRQPVRFVRTSAREFYPTEGQYLKGMVGLKNVH